MASLGHSEELKVIACAPVATIDELSFGVREVLNPVDVTTLRPEVVAALKSKFAEPELLSFGTILGIKLSCVDKHWLIGAYKLLNVVRVVNHVVADEGITNGAAAHAEHGALRALTDMDKIKDFVKSGLGLNGKVVRNWVLLWIPVSPENAVVVWENTT